MSSIIIMTVFVCIMVQTPARWHIWIDVCFQGVKCIVNTYNRNKKKWVMQMNIFREEKSFNDIMCNKRSHRKYLSIAE